MILFGMKDIGGANAILPVAKCLNGSIYADGVSFYRFKSDYPLISSSFAPDKVLDWFSPAAVVATTCSPGGVVPITLVRAAKERGIKTIVVQDFWGNHLKHSPWNPAKPEWDSNSLPDVMCVQDAFAKKLVLANWPCYNEKNIVITGQPAFDRLNNINCAKTQKELRETLGLTENWPVVYFSGQLWGMPEAVKATIDAFNIFGKPIYFILSDHPRLFSRDDSGDVKQIYCQYKDKPKELKFGTVVDCFSLKSVELIKYGADIIMGMYPTAVVEGCYLKKDCITVWTPKVKDILLAETGNILDDFPPAALGASLRGVNSEALAANLERIFRGDTGEMREAQRKHYVSDGKASSRVHHVIVKSIFFN